MAEGVVGGTTDILVGTKDAAVTAELDCICFLFHLLSAVMRVVLIFITRSGAIAEVFLMLYANNNLIVDP